MQEKELIQITYKSRSKVFANKEVMKMKEINETDFMKVKNKCRQVKIHVFISKKR